MINRKFITIVFLVMFIFSLVLGICHFEHECIGEECDICYEINLLKSIFEKIINCVLFYIVINVVTNCRINSNYRYKTKYELTPIKLKVKLTE